MMFNPDVPIKTKDDDRLGRAVFSAELATAIYNYNQSESFTIGLYGKWGSGKSSVINMVEEELKRLNNNQEKNQIIIRFNPWIFSDQNQLIHQYFKLMINELKISTGNKFLEISNLISKYSQIFTLLPVPKIEYLITVAGNVNSDIQKFYEDKQADIHLLKTSIESELTNTNIKIIIIIDDIDRLTNKEMNTIFQLVKAIADFPNTIYLLSFDYTIVSNALKEGYGIYGSDYLEKIIQVPFELPAIDFLELEYLFVSKITQIFREVSPKRFDSAEWQKIYYNCIKFYLSSVRDITRFSNVFTLKYSISKDVDVFDLIIITILQIYEKDIYNILPYFKNEICSNGKHVSANSDNLKISFDNYLVDYEGNRKKRIVEMLSFIFPKIIYAYKKELTEEYDRAFLAGNISDFNNFDNYFTLSINNKYSSDFFYNLYFNFDNSEINEEIHNIIISKKTEIFEKYTSFIYNSKSLHNDRVKMVLTSILENYSNLMFEIDNKIENHLRSSIDTLLRLLEDEDIVFLEKLTCNKQINISILLYLHEKIYINRDYYKKETLSENFLIPINNKLLQRIDEEINTDFFSKDSDLIRIIWFLESLGEWDKYFKERDFSDKELVKLISAYSEDDSDRFYPNIEHRDVDINELNKYLTSQGMYTRMVNYVETKEFWDLSPNLKFDTVTFLIKYENIKNNNDIHIRRRLIDEKLNKIQQDYDSTLPNL